MRRLLLVFALIAWAIPASAQNCITINGVTRCAMPWDIFDGTVRRVSRPVLDLRQTWNDPSVTFAGLKLNITDTNSASGSLLLDLRVGNVSQFSVSKAGVLSTGATSALGTTSTDGITLQNTTPSNATTTVQMSPRVKACGSAWNSTTALSETDCMFWEVLPATVAGTTTQTWKLGSIINGGAATYPLTMTSGSTLGVANISLSSSNGAFSYGSRSTTLSPADGQFDITNAAGTIGVMIKADALPSVSACGAGSPAVVAGSTPFAGSVTIGTTSVATCTITFNGTAFPSAPHCSGAVETTTAANARAMGYSASATVLTIVPSAAWADSSVVNWICASSK